MADSALRAERTTYTPPTWAPILDRLRRPTAERPLVDALKLGLELAYQLRKKARAASHRQSEGSHS